MTADRGGEGYRYRPEVLRQLETHGLIPASHTPPSLVRAAVRELYKYEIRRLKSRMLRQEFPRAEYSGRVEALRRRYAVLSLLPHQFVEGSAGDRD